MNRTETQGPLSSIHLLRLLISFLLPFWRQVGLSVLLGVATVASGIGLLGTSAYLIAYAALQPSVAALQVAIVGVRFFGISRAIGRYLERLVSHSVNFRLLSGLRVWFYQRLEPLAPARLQTLRSGDLLGRAVADIETLENFYVRAVAPPLVALLVVAGVGWFVARYDPRSAILLVGALLAAGVGVPSLVFLLARAPGRAVIQRRAVLNTTLVDTIQGMPDLLATGRGEAQRARISTASPWFKHSPTAAGLGRRNGECPDLPADRARTVGRSCGWHPPGRQQNRWHFAGCADPNYAFVF